MKEAWFYACSDFFIHWALREGYIVHVLHADGSEEIYP